MVQSELADPAVTTILPAGIPLRGRQTTWSRGGAIGAVIVLLLAVLAIAAPLIAPHAPAAIDSNQVLRGLSLAHPFGSDDLGRDVLSRVIYAFRASLLVAAGAIGFSLPVGVVLGTIAGYFGRVVDTLVMRPIEMILALPAMILALVIISILGAGELVTIVAIAIIYVPIFARVVRSTTQVVRQELYVTAARCRGASHATILIRHVVPNSIGPVIVQATVLAGVAIQVDAALSFLGLGVQPPTPSLGNMLAEGQNYISQAPWIEIFPGLALAVAILGFNLLGDALRERLAPGGRR